MYWFDNHPKKQILFANLVHFFSLSPFFLGGFFDIFDPPPPYALLLTQGPHMALGSQTYPFRWSKCKKELILICGSCFKTFGHPKKVILDVCYAVLTPSWGSKCPQGPHIDLYPYFHVLPLQPTKKQILFSYVVHFFSFSPFSWFFAPFLAISDPPVCLQLCPRSAYGADSSDIPFQMMKVQKQSSFFTIVLILDLGPLKKSFWRSVMQF